MAVPVSDDNNEAAGPEATPMSHRGASAQERELSRELVRAKLQLGAAPSPSIGRYRLIRALGRGGMGVVMAAHDPELDREIAIKVLHSGRGPGSETAARRLMREARSIARVSHPNVVQVHDTGVHEGRVYVVMEYVPGMSLRRWSTHGHETHEVIEMLLAAGRGLMAAHQAGVIHRDFKPANVLVGTDHRPRVVDFGLARPLDDPALPEDEIVTLDLNATSVLTTATGAVMGTPAYMAPEQFVGSEASPRSDQFAFCVTLFEALLGRRPFPGNTFTEICNAVLHSGLRFPPEAQSLPEALRQVIARGLRRRRSERFPDMASLLHAIERSVGSPRKASPIPAPRVSHAEQRERFPRLRTYLEGLPDGASSHHECTMAARILRLALAHHPIDQTQMLPPAVATLLRSTLTDAEWIPEVHARIVLTVVRDLHFPAGPAGNDQWMRMLGRIYQAVMSMGFFGFAMPSANSSRLLAASLRLWQGLHRGTLIEIEQAAKSRAVLYMEHPTGLLGGLGPPEVLSAVQAAMSMSRVEYTDARVLEAKPTSLRFELHWA
ncbi:MAG: serine/threonine-protein kinase [Myxococcota bacterium]